MFASVNSARSYVLFRYLGGIIYGVNNNAGPRTSYICPLVLFTSPNFLSSPRKHLAATKQLCLLLRINPSIVIALAPMP